MPLLSAKGAFFTVTAEEKSALPGKDAQSPAAQPRNIRTLRKGRKMPRHPEDAGAHHTVMDSLKERISVKHSLVGGRERGVDILPAACRVGDGALDSGPELDHLRDRGHRLAVLGVLHGDVHPRIALRLRLEGLQRERAERAAVIHLGHALVGQHVVLDELNGDVLLL